MLSTKDQSKATEMDNGLKVGPALQTKETQPCHRGMRGHCLVLKVGGDTALSWESEGSRYPLTRVESWGPEEASALSWGM